MTIDYDYYLINQYVNEVDDEEELFNLASKQIDPLMRALVEFGYYKDGDKTIWLMDLAREADDNAISEYILENYKVHSMPDEDVLKNHNNFKAFLLETAEKWLLDQAIEDIKFNGV